MKKKWLPIIIAVPVISIFIIGSFFVVRSAYHAFQAKTQNIFGLALQIGTYNLDWLSTRIILSDVGIYPAGKTKGEKLASAEQIILDISPLHVLGKELHASKIIFKDPVFNYTKYSAKRSNWDALDLSELKDEDDKQDKSKSASDWLIRLDKIIIKDGQVKYVLPSGGKAELKDVEAKISNLVSEPDYKKLPTKISLKAKVGDTEGRIKVKGRANVLSEGINFDLESSLSEMNLTYFAPFYAGEVPFTIQSGRIFGTSQAKSEKSKFVAHNDIVLKNLKAAGLRGKLINSLFLRHGNKVKVKATAKGNLEEGDVVIFRSTTRAITKQLMAQAVKDTPVDEASETVKESGRQVKDKLKGIFGK